ncbi:uncharacterized protein LOC128185348 [Crassostrea angulata]|uniref:uncharacterized protein LOC128185348 n=1 Tax=Magallana angulata TaxID=2784310 RepID=UPI0022B09DA9|nr:uncharacterized protein LOC128185348 [Crassostrea angulata]
MEICVTFAIFYMGMFYVHDLQAATTQSTLYSSGSTTAERIITLSETTTSSTEEMSTTDKTSLTPTSLLSTTFTKEKLSSKTETPTTSTEKITTSTTVLPETTTSTTEKLTSTAKTPTTLTEKITSTENVSTVIPFVTQMTKSDNKEEVIAALGTIAGVSLLANVILSILLFRNCRRISGDIDTTPIYSNENIQHTDQTEMYTGLDVKEDGSVYQTSSSQVKGF